MPDSYLVHVAGAMRSYYKDFSKYAKGREPSQKVAWVTSFTPIEILDALDIEYIYPESYSAVIAASGLEQPLLEESTRQHLSCDCCSYSCCFEGCVETGKGPRGVPPKPDVLIATNNQCNTLPGWWSILAKRYNVPLIILDYPGEFTEDPIARAYVEKQHKDLVLKMEELSGNKLDEDELAKRVENSIASVAAWKRVCACLKDREVPPTLLFDNINFLITARCKEETALIYNLMADEMETYPECDKSLTPLFWIGYPLWYHKDRYLTEIMDGFRVCGSNYITWWNLDYEGDTVWDKLFSAYNATFLNLSQKTKTDRLSALISASGAKCAVTCRNKSCKCDYVSARNVGIPQAELEVDRIDREYLDVERAGKLMAILKETVI
ncbi:MAG: 2-hydroxyacyl-CoA dehydratase family protein [Oscillospiraceae bacterium]|nr:2-hydroxyacyl-CoA dehydratase family protein [Oscillospiraceae bacterium]